MFSQELLNFILEWITLQTEYDSKLFDYDIILLTSEELQKKACGGKCPIVAFFDFNEGVLISRLDFDNLCNQSILLHEIIHALQYIHDSELSFPFREKEAYEIQNKFLFQISEKLELDEILNIKKCRSLQANVLR
jgi:hypothetical protein